MNTPEPSADVLETVRERYARGAAAQVPELCCPVTYDARYLAVLPREILERDYGCGDPSRFVRRGDVVLDLGSGAGKICFIASQITGPEGRVIGVDATPEMLALAREHREAIAARIGWSNVEFRRGRIQDLAIDLERVESFLSRRPVRTLDDLVALRTEETRLARDEPMVATGSVDLVLSNCVLNLVAGADKRALFAEIHRVLKRGGRCAISDIVCDEDVPEELQRDPELWSGCISGALREDRFLNAFADAGLYGVEIAAYQREPWAVVRGIEFRSLTVVAWKGKEGPCKEHNEAVIYNGPWKRVVDDDGHVLERGMRTAVCRKTFELYGREPYGGQITKVAPLVAIAPEDAREFDCRRSAVRTPEETKFGVQRADVAPGASCCEPGGSCC
ncbi:MAG: methyltransferase domain-containing protein [Planctomycetes bacterium]|nr:methyltransferase domain-containing protein [Planctomycetota bacterium]